MNRDTKLEAAIRELICKVYGFAYIGKLKVAELEYGGYEVNITLGIEDQPLHISAQLEWEDFLKFIEKELRSRHLHSAKYYTGYKIDAYEQRRTNRVNKQCYH